MNEATPSTKQQAEEAFNTFRQKYYMPDETPDIVDFVKAIEVVYAQYTALPFLSFDKEEMMVKILNDTFAQVVILGTLLYNEDARHESKINIPF
jgi:hypothetical protein